MPGIAGRLVLALVISLFVSAQALAQACTVSLPTIAFGNVDVLPGTVVDTTATVSITCSGGNVAGQRVCISLGAGSANDATSRQMTAGSNKVRYDLYSDSSRTTLWGSWHTGYDSAGVQLDVPQNMIRTATVFARFFASQQTAIPGSYSSTLTTTDVFIGYRNNNGSTCPLTNRTATSTSSVTATVISNCTLSATALSFGSQGFLPANVDQTSTIQAKCTNTTPYILGLNAGTGTGATTTTRKMTSGGNTINYTMWQNSGRTTNWGNTVGTDTQSSTGTGVTQSFTVFGRVPSGQIPPPASYSDTITVTATF